MVAGIFNATKLDIFAKTCPKLLVILYNKQPYSLMLTNNHDIIEDMILPRDMQSKTIFSLALRYLKAQLAFFW